MNAIFVIRNFFSHGTRTSTSNRPLIGFHFASPANERRLAVPRGDRSATVQIRPFAAHSLFIDILSGNCLHFAFPHLRSAAEAVERRKVGNCCCRNGDREQRVCWRRNRAGPGVRGWPALHQPGLHRRGCLRDGRVSNVTSVWHFDATPVPPFPWLCGRGRRKLVAACERGVRRALFTRARGPTAPSRQKLPNLGLFARASGGGCLHCTDLVFVFPFCHQSLFCLIYFGLGEVALKLYVILVFIFST